MFFSAASSLGRSTDGVFVVLAVVSAVVLVLVTLVFLFLVVRYGRRRHPLASDSAGSAFWEVACTLGAAALVLFFFYLGLGGFAALTTSPADAMVVRVTARMWSWSFEYPGGLKSRRLVLAAGAPVRLVLSSPDVIHSLYVPAFRVKRDVVPGRDASVSFTPDRVGGYDLFCAEFCGLGHSRMVARVEVLSAGDFSAWYGGAEPDEAAAEKPAPADEKKAAERKAAEKLAAEKRAAEQKAAEQKAAEKKAAEKRAAEKRAAEKRAAEKRAAEKKAAERKAAEEREAEEKKEAEKPAPPAEKKVVEKKPA
ncbi:MAG: cytochrome c oxidase subunit II, partial [Thermodesulfobacteriota bacterium]